MYTLKIKWMRYDKIDPPDDPEASTQYKLADEAEFFIPADKVHAHGHTTEADMTAWEDGSYFNYRIQPTENTSWASRLIMVEHNGKSTWYLASMAWLMGPNGDTIERLI